MLNDYFICYCGQKLKGIKVNEETRHKIVCQKCGRIYYIDENMIDWERANKGEIYGTIF